MPQAKYTVLVPTADELEQPLRLSQAVFQHLSDNRSIQSLNVHPGDPYDAVIAWAEDQPESDSTMKQVGAFAAEVANVPTIVVTKEAKNSASWPMTNPHYQPGVGAEPSALLVAVAPAAAQSPAL